MYATLIASCQKSIRSPIKSITKYICFAELIALLLSMCYMYRMSDLEIIYIALSFD